MKEIQIVSFDNPYPPNYGGVIDVFYKIKSFHDIGYKIHLHCFYDDRIQFEPLEKYCHKIYQYPKRKNILLLLSQKPYRNAIRNSKELIENIEKTMAPIIFEGLHSTTNLLGHNLKNNCYLRTHNIEHDYHLGLSKKTSNIFKKLFYSIEALKFKKYERIVNTFRAIITLSKKDNIYFSSKYNLKTHLIPVFHGNTTIESKEGFGKFAFYHGDLRISDNIESALFLIKIFSKTKYKLIIGGSVFPKKISKIIKTYKNIQFKNITNNYNLELLLREAHINISWSFQESGTKLKVFNSLYKGRHCIINKNIVDDKKIQSLCHMVKNENEILNTIDILFNKKFTLEDNRTRVLMKYTTDQSIKKIVSILNQID